LKVLSPGFNQSTLPTVIHLCHVFNILRPKVWQPVHRQKVNVKTIVLMVPTHRVQKYQLNLLAGS